MTTPHRKPRLLHRPDNRLKIVVEKGIVKALYATDPAIKIEVFDLDNQCEHCLDAIHDRLDRLKSLAHWHVVEEQAQLQLSPCQHYIEGKP